MSTGFEAGAANRSAGGPASLWRSPKRGRPADHDGSSGGAGERTGSVGAGASPFASPTRGGAAAAGGAAPGFFAPPGDLVHTPTATPLSARRSKRIRGSAGGDGTPGDEDEIGTEPLFRQRREDLKAGRALALRFTSDEERLRVLLADLNKPHHLIITDRKSTDEGFQGELQPRAYKGIMEFFRDRCGASTAAGSHMLDIGSAAGKPCFSAVLSGIFAQATGVEINRVEQFSNYFAELYDVAERVRFHRADAGVWLPDGPTHIYSFNKTFPGRDLHRIAAVLNKQKTWKYMVTNFPASVWAGDYGLSDVEDMPDGTLTGLCMAGSGRQYAMYAVQRKVTPPTPAAPQRSPTRASPSASAAGGSVRTVSTRSQSRGRPSTDEAGSSAAAAAAGGAGTSAGSSSAVAALNDPPELRRSARKGAAFATALDHE